jgi:hypothetical protein
MQLPQSHKEGANKLFSPQRSVFFINTQYQYPTSLSSNATLSNPVRIEYHGIAYSHSTILQSPTAFQCFNMKALSIIAGLAGLVAVSFEAPISSSRVEVDLCTERDFKSCRRSAMELGTCSTLLVFRSLCER